MKALRLNRSTLVTALSLALMVSVGINVYQKTGFDAGKPPAIGAPVDEPLVMRTPGGLLEVSTITATETFESLHAHSIFGAEFAKTWTQIRVPVVYRYHIELAKEWRILLRDKTFIVIAPPVKPTLPVAINTQGMQKATAGIWSAITGRDLLDQLQQKITPALAIRSDSVTYRQLQRDAARKTLTEFVGKWLITQTRWKSASDYPIRVYFSDEQIASLGETAAIAALR